MRICFVALEVLGPFNGGGIATALAGQAEHHAKAHDVTILYVHPSLKQQDAGKWEAFYAKRNIRFVRAEFDTFYPLDTIPKRSFAVKQYLEDWEEDFDVIFFHDYLGLGYYTALTRQLGLGFEDTHIVSSVHGPSEWARPLSMAEDKAWNITLYELERKQLEYSDVVVGPSQDIIDWCREQGWTLPKDARAISNLLPHRLDLHSGLQQGDVAEVDEVCFFGRLETRKGFFTFLDAIKYMHKNQLTLPKKITFLGGFCNNGKRNSASSVFEYAAKWDCEVQLLNTCSHEEAITYLVENKPLTVIASRDESFGLTAYECLAFGVPTLISNRGALRGLAAEPEREKLLFDPTADILARRIADCLDDGAVIGAVDPAHLQAETVWDTLLDDLSKPARKPDPRHAVCCLDPVKSSKVKAPKKPLVSIILVHHNRAKMLAGALDSLLEQTYENIEIIVVDDGSVEAEFAGVEDLIKDRNDPRVRLVRQQNRYLGAARNFGNSFATGDYLFFMDDDNFASPEEIETFVRVALTTDADVLNTVSKMFRMDTDGTRKHFDIYPPVGPSLQLAILGNTFGDANSLVRKATFDELGGFTEKYAVGCEDYEFFTHAFVSGKKMQLVPELLFDYRSEDEGMMKELNSGKYLVNQLRGVNALFDTHRDIDLAQVRSLMRMTFHSAVAEEFDYWLNEGMKLRKHPDLERELQDHINNPNGRQACEVVAKMMTADGDLLGAMKFLDRNGIVPSDASLVKLRYLYDRYQEAERGAVAKQNIIINPAFEFWSRGSRFEGVQPYEYVANEWLLPSPKFRPDLIASQRVDNALFSQTRTRTGTYIRLQMNAPDPEGYLFLSQRNFDLNTVLEQELELSLLARASYEAELVTFLRITYDPDEAHLVDIHPEEPARIGRGWQRSTLKFDLTSHRLDAMKTASFLSLFIAIPVDNVLSVDLADVTLIPAGPNAEVAAYVHGNEKARAEHRCFTAGAGARAMPSGGNWVNLTLSPAQSERIMRDSRFYMAGPVSVLMGKEQHMKAEIQRIDLIDVTPGSATIALELDAPLPAEGEVLTDCLVVTNYVEGWFQ
ncbi:glycosyltransferase [Halovulum sp. GXIMD14793]